MKKYIIVLIAYNSTQLKQRVSADLIGDFRNVLQKLGSSQTHAITLSVNDDNDNFHESEEGTFVARGYCLSDRPPERNFTKPIFGDLFEF